MQKEQRILLDRLYLSIQKHTDCVVYKLSSNEQSNLKKWFSENINSSSYDRIILFLRAKKEMKQNKFIRTIPNLVFLEHDAYQNYIPCKYQGKFSTHYKKMPWARILTSGFYVAKQLQQEGLDAVFVPKGYDEKMMKNLALTRDIELGFIGSIKDKTYAQRKEWLTNLAEKENLFITRTKSGNEYVQTLNRIRFFISADIGMGEYMIKNFEAMACGCVLFAYDQGAQENNALGFKDMENIVLYSSLEDLHCKLQILRKDSALAQKIAKQGQAHAEQYFTFDDIGKKIAEALTPQLRIRVEKRFFGIKYYTIA